MPANLTIGFFVLGAVLILVALVGGKFKIFVAEVSPAVTNPFIRAVAFVLGLGFILLALYPGMIVLASDGLNKPAEAVPNNIQPDQAPLFASPMPMPTELPPTFTNTPILPLPSPTEFIVSYWQNVSDQRFESSWAQLSPRFQHIMHNDDFYSYVRGLQDMQICQILPSNAALIAQGNNSATVTVHVIFYMGAQCKVSAYDFETLLVYDEASNSWLLDKNNFKP